MKAKREAIELFGRCLYDFGINKITMARKCAKFIANEKLKVAVLNDDSKLISYYRDVKRELKKL